jgi:hypothetical protein
MEPMAALESGYFDFAPEDCLGIRDSDLAEEIVSLAKKKRVRQHFQLHI